MNMKFFRQKGIVYGQILRLVFGSSFLLLAASACVSPLKSKAAAALGGTSSGSNSGPSSGSPTGQPTGGSQPSPTPTPLVVISPVPSQTMNLGVSLAIPVLIQSQNGYSGPVSLSINNKVLAANDPMNTITVAVAPSAVNLTASGSASATVTVTSTSSSPDLISNLSVVATTSSGQVISQIPLTIKPIFEVDILSSGNLDTTGIEDWSIAAGTTTNFTTHTAGVSIVFCNKDTVEKSGFYRIHSSGTAFLHQGSEGLGVPGSATPDVNDGTAAKSNLTASTLGPCYTTDVLSQVAQLKNIYYDHNNETPAKATRTMVFNAYAAPPKIGNSGNPNATFSYIQKNLINTSQCMTCHVTNPSTQGNNINFSTYAGVVTQVQAGSALGSPFYVQIAAGGTMPLGNPDTVSSALLQDVEDWINDGALNN